MYIVCNSLYFKLSKYYVHKYKMSNENEWKHYVLVLGFGGIRGIKILFVIHYILNYQNIMYINKYKIRMLNI